MRREGTLGRRGWPCPNAPITPGYAGTIGVWKDVGVTVEAIRSGIDLSLRRLRCPPPRRSVRPCQRPLADRVQDPGRPRDRRRVPVALRPRRGAGPRPDHRSRYARRHQGTDEQRIGDLYASFMDEQTVAERGVQPLLDELADDRRAPKPPRPWRRWWARCSATASAAARASTSTPTPRTRRATWCTSTSPGSDCPTSPTTATSSTPRSSPRIRSTSPRCSPSCTAGDHAETAARIVALETKLAAAHWDVVKRRDADLTYNLRTFADLPAEAPGLRLGRLGDRTGHDAGCGRGSRCAPAGLPDCVRRGLVGRGPRGLEELGPLAADPRSRRPC